ncbi:MAG: SDR family NAD(P)-dependent oxidoreductase [Xanthobacteraceae bacterium]
MHDSLTGSAPPNNPLFDLSGRVALVTGGNGGIGHSMALGLHRAGARVVIAGRDARKGAGALEHFRGGTAQALFLEADVAEAAQCQRLVEETVAAAGGLDILINNAGITARYRPEDLTLENWDKVLRVNLTSAFLCAQAAYPVMKDRGRGKIINIGSMMSIFGAPFAAAYGASKGGMVQLTKSLATAWAADGIQVNAILPGWVDTDMGDSARLQVPGLSERVLARTPANRWGTGMDYEGVAVFLASPASDFVTGTALPVDGGYSISG